MGICILSPGHSSLDENRETFRFRFKDLLYLTETQYVMKNFLPFTMHIVSVVNENDLHVIVEIYTSIGTF